MCSEIAKKPSRTSPVVRASVSVTVHSFEILNKIVSDRVLVVKIVSARVLVVKIVLWTLFPQE